MAAAQLDRPTALCGTGYRRPAAPFTRAVHAADRRTVRCYAGCDAWFRARTWVRMSPGGAMVLPGDTDPEALWWPVAGREVLVIAPGVVQQRLDALLKALIRDGAVRAVAAERMDGRGAGPESRGELRLIYAQPEVATYG